MDFVLFSGITLTVVGEVLIGLAVLNVHRHVIHEHKIDDDVVRAMKRERRITMAGIILIIIGYLIEVYFLEIFLFFI